jgi:hypothetical protein
VCLTALYIMVDLPRGTIAQSDNRGSFAANLSKKRLPLAASDSNRADAAQNFANRGCVEP